MQFLKMFRRQRLSSFQNSPSAIVAVPYFQLFRIGHRQDAQRQDLIDLGPVEEIPGTLRRDLRIVVEDDRRGQYGIALPFFSNKHRPRADVAAFRRGPLAAAQVDRAEETNSPPPALENAVDGNQRSQQNLVSDPLAGMCSSALVSDNQGDLEVVIVETLRSQLELSIQSIEIESVAEGGCRSREAMPAGGCGTVRSRPCWQSCSAINCRKRTFTSIGVAHFQAPGTRSAFASHRSPSAIRNIRADRARRN